MGTDGRGKQVEAFGDCDNTQMTPFTAQVLLLTGAPCTMEFPFNLTLSVKN